MNRFEGLIKLLHREPKQSPKYVGEHTNLVVKTDGFTARDPIPRRGHLPTQGQHGKISKAFVKPVERTIKKLDLPQVTQEAMRIPFNRAHKI